MKYIILILFLLTSFPLLSQRIVSDSIGVNYNTNVVLLFESKIKPDGSSSPGSSEIIVKPSDDLKTITLKANVLHMKPTNLIVETQSAIYNFYVYFDQRPDQYVYTIGQNLAIAITNSAPVKSSDLAKTNSNEGDATSGNSENSPSPDQVDVKSLAELVKTKSDQFKSKGSYDPQSKMIFQFLNVYATSHHLIFKIQLINKSNIPYDIEYFRYLVRENQGLLKKSTDQIRDLKPIYILNESTKRIDSKTSVEKILVFEKFTLDPNEEFFIEADEVGGKRNISMHLSNSTILNAKYLKQ